MRKILVFVRCEIGKTYQVAADLADGDRAPEVDSISGDYDLLAQYRVTETDDIGRIVAQEIQQVPGIQATNTIICFNPFTKDAGLKEENG